MSRKRILIIIMTLFMVVFAPKMVEAAGEYYVCYTVSSVPTSDGRQLIYKAPYYKFESGKLYEKTYYTSEGKYPATSLPKIQSTYKLYKKVDNIGVCSDAYAGDETVPTTYTYDEYIDLIKKRVIYDNMFDAKKYKKQKEEVEQVEKDTELYICVTQTEFIQGTGSRQWSFSDVYHKYSSTKYESGTHGVPGANSQTHVANTYSVYKLKDTANISGKSVSDVCTDSYGSKAYSYDEYKNMIDMFNIINNKITVEQIEKYVEVTKPEVDTNTPKEDEYEQCKDGWWTCAWNFLNKGSNSEHQFGNDSIGGTIEEIKDLIFDVGNIIFILVTAYLGVKYIWGGVNSKFSVKNSLITLVVAAIVFYGWNAVTNILDVQGLLTGTTASGGHMSMVNRIYNTIMYIINIAAIGGIIYIGIRYAMAGAEGKSELKLKGIPIVMGVMMVYGTINLINFVLKIVEDL